MGKVYFERLRENREALHLSLDYVANLIDIDPSELNKIETGSLSPNKTQLEVLSEIYGCSKQYFFQEEGVSKSKLLTRNGDYISEFDQKQIENFLVFQKEISKRKH